MQWPHEPRQGPGTFGLDVNWPTNPGERWPASAARSSADGLARETRRKMEVTGIDT